MARNDQIVRILTVARALSQSRRGVSLKALAERHGWPWRTVYRDVDALDRAGFPIEKEDRRHRLIDGWNAPHLPGIEPDEILALYTIRALSESWRATALGRPLDRLWMKLTATGGGQGALMPVTREPWFLEPTELRRSVAKKTGAAAAKYDLGTPDGPRLGARQAPVRKGLKGNVLSRNDNRQG